MEKYRKFADSFTGKNPFLPVFLNNRKSLGYHLIHWLVGLLLIIIRLPVLLITILILSIYNSLVSKLIPISKIRRVFDILSSKIGFRIIMACFGFYVIPTPKRLKKKLTSLSGSIIYSNHQSPIDVFYLSQLSAGQFGIINYLNKGEDKEEVYVQPLSFLQSLKLVFNKNYVISQDLKSNLPSNCKTFVQASKDSKSNSQGPLILFYEGCNTNGQGVLKFDEDLLEETFQYQQNSQKDVLLVQIKYSRTDFYTPINTTRNAIWHLFILMTNFTNSLKVQAKEVQLPTSGKQADYIQNFDSFYKSCGQQILSPDHTTYLEFLDFWGKTKSKSKYTKDVKTEKIGQKYM